MRVPCRKSHVLLLTWGPIHPVADVIGLPRPAYALPSFLEAPSHFFFASMLRYTPCTRHTSWAAISCRLQWRGILHRRHASTSADDAQWFPQLRDQMLQRGAIHLPDHLTTPPEYRLAQTLMGFLPLECCSLPASHKPILPVGHHLIWFNPAVPTDHLLPDGTDASHSPGGPWVRRMWAGGSLKLNSDDYFNKRNGFARDTPMTGVERIKHVQLRGQGDAAKIFVTIERRFARLDTLKQRYSALYDRLGKDSGLPKIQAFFENQLLSDDDWGDALLKEERNLVFLKERSTEELGAIKAGQVTPIKYLDRAYVDLACGPSANYPSSW